MLGITFDQRFHEGGFANARRSNDGHNYGRSFFGEAVDERDMQALLLDLVFCKLDVDSLSSAVHTSCERTACFAKRPGFA